MPILHKPGILNKKIHFHFSSITQNVTHKSYGGRLVHVATISINEFQARKLMTFTWVLSLALEKYDFG